MVKLTPTHSLLALLALARLGAASCIPSEGDAPANGGSGDAKFVVYSDKWINGQQMPPPPDQIKGINVFILSFLLTTGPADQADVWAKLDKDSRTKLKEAYKSAGIKLLVSAFGATDTPTTAGADPVKTADDMAQWVIDNDVDGIDVDYEDLEAVPSGGASDWVINFTKQLRTKLPQGKYIITHAPLGPWFSPVDDVYLKVHKAVGDQIDWYNIQFYNQGESEYTTCEGLLTQSSSQWPKSSIFEIAETVPKEKLIIGKPQTTADANNGFMEAGMLSQCLAEAKEKGWNGGAMVWQYDGQSTVDWINTVRGKAFPA